MSFLRFNPFVSTGAVCCQVDCAFPYFLILEGGRNTMEQLAVKMQRITKIFGGVKANDAVDFSLRQIGRAHV